MQCPKKMAQQQTNPNAPARQGVPQQAAGNCGQAYNRGKVNHLEAEAIQVVHIATTAQEKTKSWKETSRSSKTTTNSRCGLAATPSQLSVKALSLLRFA
jgi:hypothetical protein